MKESSKQLQEAFGLDAKSASSVAALELKLAKQAETFGMSADEAAIYKLEVAGIGPAALQAAKDMVALNARMKEMAKVQTELEGKGKATFDSTRTSAEKYKAAIHDLKAQLKAGAIDQDTYARAVKKTKAEFGETSVIGKFGATAAKGFALVGAAALGAAAAIGVYSMGALRGLKDQGDFANALGISVKDFTELQYAAAATGAHIEDIQPALKTFGQQLGEAQQTGVGPTVDGLKMIGMSLEDISKLDPAAQFKAINKGFQSLKTPAEQAAAANLLFAEDGIKLINTLKTSPEVLAKFGKDAEKLGQSWSDADAKMAGDAVKSVDQIWGVFSGIGSKIAVGFAPIITDLATKFLDWATTSVDVGKIVSGSIDLVAMGVGYASDVFNSFKIIGMTAYASVTSGAAGLVMGIDAVGKGVVDLLNLLPGFDLQWSTTIGDVSKGLQELAGKQWSDVKKAFDNPPSNSITKYFDGMKAAADDAAKAINKAGEESRKTGEAAKGLVTPFTTLRDDLQKQIELFGLTEAQKKIAEFKKLNPTTGQVAEIEGLQKKLKGKEDTGKLKEQAKTLAESLATPMEQAAKKQKDLDKMRAAGFLTPEMYERGKKEASKGLEGNTPKFSSALDVGSQEARSALLAFNGLGKQDSMKTVEKNTSEANGYLKSIASGFANVNTKKQRVEEIRI